jgi:WhiB family redox-sensing transcriptional regulator
MSNLRKPSDYENPLCAQVGGDLFYSDDFDEKGEDSLIRFKMAKKICTDCEHINECYMWGLKYEQHGIWGGTTPSDRKDIRRKNRLNPPIEILYN